MNLSTLIGILGLIISIWGTIVIWFDSQRLFNRITELLNDIAPTIGFWRDDPIAGVKMDKYKNTIEKSSKLDKKGFCLLIIGFVLQLLPLFKFKFFELINLY